MQIILDQRWLARDERNRRLDSTFPCTGISFLETACPLNLAFFTMEPQYVNTCLLFFYALGALGANPQGLVQWVERLTVEQEVAGLISVAGPILRISNMNITGK